MPASASKITHLCCIYIPLVPRLVQNKLLEVLYCSGCFANCIKLHTWTPRRFFIAGRSITEGITWYRLIQPFYFWETTILLENSHLDWKNPVPGRDTRATSPLNSALQAGFGNSSSIDIECFHVENQEQGFWLRFNAPRLQGVATRVGRLRLTRVKFMGRPILDQRVYETFWDIYHIVK